MGELWEVVPSKYIIIGTVHSNRSVAATGGLG